MLKIDQNRRRDVNITQLVDEISCLLLIIWWKMLKVRNYIWLLGRFYISIVTIEDVQIVTCQCLDRQLVFVYLKDKVYWCLMISLYLQFSNSILNAIYWYTIYRFLPNVMNYDISNYHFTQVVKILHCFYIWTPIAWKIT